MFLFSLKGGRLRTVSIQVTPEATLSTFPNLQGESALAFVLVQLHGVLLFFLSRKESEWML